MTFLHFAAERNWPTYDFVHNEKGNRLTYVCRRTFKLLKQLLNRNNGLLLILTPNNTDLSLTCDC